MPPWTAPELFVRVLRSVRRQPLALFAALALLPGVWGIPAELAYARWVPGEEGAIGEGRSSLAFTLSFAAIVWNSIWGAGGIRIGIDTARGRAVRFRHLLEGVAYTPWLVCTALPLLPLELFVFLPTDDDPAFASIAFGSVTVLTLVLLLRTALWAPYLLDSGTSLGAALTASWRATREQGSQMLLLALLLTLPIVPVAAIEIALSGRAYVAIGLTSLLYTLAVGHLYTLAHDRTERSLQSA